MTRHLHFRSPRALRRSTPAVSTFGIRHSTSRLGHDPASCRLGQPPLTSDVIAMSAIAAPFLPRRSARRVAQPSQHRHPGSDAPSHYRYKYYPISVTLFGGAAGAITSGWGREGPDVGRRWHVNSLAARCRAGADRPVPTLRARKGSARSFRSGFSDAAGHS